MVSLSGMSSPRRPAGPQTGCCRQEPPVQWTLGDLLWVKHIQVLNPVRAHWGPVERHQLAAWAGNQHALWCHQDGGHSVGTRPRPALLWLGWNSSCSSAPHTSTGRASQYLWEPPGTPYGGLCTNSTCWFMQKYPLRKKNMPYLAMYNAHPRFLAQTSKKNIFPFHFFNSICYLFIFREESDDAIILHTEVILAF